MAFRSMSNWKWLANGVRRYATATTPKTKAYAPTASEFAELQRHQGRESSKSKKGMKGDFVPVYVAIGMICLSTTLGLYTARQQLFYSPNVFVKKQRRETLPEVVEPDHVLEDADKFFNKSFFRKVAHIKNPTHDHVISDPTRGDAFVRRPRAETLKSVGVDPVLS
ncbi:hypothetical protein FNV43_RR15319 [Rhamnella rubrinervis]|uniref:Uncharacterized protein n=1 Tax=Rhamnella rubrinervis TaxID=2594499 RepID=A0A8K0E8T9_9ROSA|nr:hypothetical protein FNV43_RR15319 [Rhamnella rubrinervis]